MGEFVRTVTGDVAPDTLGHCQCHEHIFLEMDRSYEVSPVLYMDDYDKSLAELREYRAAGGGTIVDAQPVLGGRMAELLERASVESGVKIIASTGFHKTIFYYEDSYLFYKNEDEIARLYIEEIEEGMFSSKQTGAQRLACRAGQIKTAIDKNGIHADETYEKLFAAAADAALATGVPVMVHIEQEADALHVVDFFAKRGLPPQHLILYDTIHRLKYHDDVKEAELIAFMLESGFEEQLLLGLDTTNARLRSYGAADMGLDFILKTFVPFAEERGISRQMMHKMLVANPPQALKIKRSV